jgi:DNA-binding response OmpR family regulator
MNAGPPPTILVVDDDARSLDLMQLVLRHAGYRVLAAPDGATALDLLATERPAVTLADLLMPGMSGLELCIRVRDVAALSGMGFVLVTGMDEEDTRRRAREAGADDVVTKPFDRSDLLARLARLAQR